MILSALSRTYASFAAARRRSFARHPNRLRRLTRPVVSVGNLSVGGSGKTPAVAYIARLLVDAGERPVILTRGYRRRERTEAPVVVSDGERLCADVHRAGDEPMMLARALPGVPVIVGADRYRSGLVAERRFPVTVHLLDDGFQHVQLARDVDIVLVSEDDERDRVLPAGRLRESLDALASADAIVYSGTPGLAFNLADKDNLFIAARALAPAPVSAPPVFAVAGIARPVRFFDALTAAGWAVAGRQAFRDHHWFTASDLARLQRAARESGATRIVTTEKDLVRLLPLRPFPMPIDAVPLLYSIEPADAFRDWLLERVRASHPARSAELFVGRPFRVADDGKAEASPGGDEAPRTDKERS